ncbi:hypothetical protein BDN70DRAFT_895250 [Pholiota conissans]|uniref:Uncharacterized protein n=1 Tax=Pholiota conissans TaxID=109636 RepID=A0A9P5Z2P9_9AGAR|nr:hypothetical protein BDN70DRAFT_895250 [Pholiota conissans]
MVYNYIVAARLEISHQETFEPIELFIPMANFSCDTTATFSSINDLLVQANAGNLNITNYVDFCPQVCTLPWGTGYQILPDFGINISYILQATFTFLFGPLFCVAYWLRNRWNIGNIGNKAKENLKVLQATFIDTAALFSITVSAAAIARFLQHAQIYELTFLRTLTTTQFLSLLSSIVASGVFEERVSGLRITVLVLYGLLDFGLYMGLIGSLLASQAGWQTLIDLERACADNGNPKLSLLHIIAAKAESSDVSVDLSGLDSLTGWQYGLTLFALTIAGILLSAIIVIVIRLLKISIILAIQAFWKVLARKEARAFMSFAFASGMLAELVFTEKARNAMISLTESGHAEKKWGFLVLLLWVPLWMRGLYTLKCEFSAALSHFANLEALYVNCSGCLRGCSTPKFYIQN